MKTDGDPTARARTIHDEPCVFDLHADTFYRIEMKGGSFHEKTNIGHIDRPRLELAGVACTVQAIYTPQDQPGADGLQFALQLASRILAAVDESNRVHMVRNQNDLDLDTLGVLMHLEGVSPLEEDLDRLLVFEALGVRSIGLTHNHANEAAGGCNDQSQTLGLTPFGRKLLATMETRGIALDVAHLGEKALGDVFDHATRPFYSSHTGLRARCDDPRNLSDEALEQVVASGGIVGIDFVPQHLTGSESASVEHVFEHIDHVVSRHGIQSVACGSDFDGYDSPTQQLSDITDLPNLTRQMLASGYSEEDVRLVLGGNAQRFFSELLPTDSFR